MHLVSELVDRDFLSRPDVFRHDALRVSCQLLRGYRPQLALRLQNLLQDIPLCDNSSDEDHAGNYYRVELPVADLVAICDGMEAAGEAYFSRPGQPQVALAEAWVVVWAVIADWRRLLEFTRKQRLAEARPVSG